MVSWHLQPTATSVYPGNFKDPALFIKSLRMAINDQASAIQFYGQLEGLAPTQYRDFITHAKDDERVHLRLLRKLYRRLTGTDAPVQAEPIQFSSYKQGLEIAFRNELDAAESYRDLYLSSKDRRIRDILFRTMTDEMEHAQRFSFLYHLA